MNQKNQNEGAFEELMTLYDLYTERVDFEKALAHFYQKVREQGITTREVDPNKVIYTWPERDDLTFEVPESRKGVSIRLFVEPTGGDVSAVKDVGALEKELEENASILSKTGHLLVQSREDDEILSFSYRGEVIVPDSKYAESSHYRQRLECTRDAKKGMDLAFEIYRNSNRREPERDRGPSLLACLV